LIRVITTKTGFIMNVEAVENIVLEKSIKKFVKGLAKSESVTIFNSYSKDSTGA